MAEAAYQAPHLPEKKMSKNFVQDGKNVDWLNGTGKVVSSGYLVVQDNLVGVAHADIPDGDVGILHTVGVFSLPKPCLTAGLMSYLRLMILHRYCALPPAIAGGVLILGG